MSEVYLISTIRPASDKIEQVGKILCRTAEHVKRVEKGCFTFLLTEIHNVDGDVEFKVIERWADADHLSQHQRRDWLQQMYAEFEDQHLLAADEEIQRLEFVAGFASR